MNVVRGKQSHSVYQPDVTEGDNFTYKDLTEEDIVSFRQKHGHEPSYKR